MSVAAHQRSGASGTQHAVTCLRRALLDGEIVAGQRLIEPDLAAAFGVNRSSVRAALIELAAEGLVERVPNKGARVRLVPIEEAIAINECRTVLDGLCAAKAAEVACDEDIGRLRAIGEGMRSAVETGRTKQYTTLNIELCGQVRAISGQFVATRLLERLHEQLVRHQFHLAADLDLAREWLPEHLAIIEAIARHDAARAELATRTHLSNVTAVLRAMQRRGAVRGA